MTLTVGHNDLELHVLHHIIPYSLCEFGSRLRVKCKT